jgi:proteasome lid subunit RPN8/RPN11
MSWHDNRVALRAVDVLIVPRSVFQEIQKHVLDQYPVEACGFLSGRFDHGKAEAQRCVVVKNIAASADRFVLDPMECERVRQNVLPNEQLVGFFHSHAKCPEPSGLDKINMRFLPLVWLIVGGVENGVASERDCLGFKTHRKDALMVKLEFTPDKPKLPLRF